MKISDIILEAVDQKEADEVLKSLVASGDPSAKFFQQTRYNPVHSSIDSAQRAAERMAQAEQKRKASPQATAATKTQASAVRQQSKQKPEKQDRDPEDYSDRFYGNRYTGSLGRGARLGDVDLDIDFDQSGLQTIGKTIGAVKAAAKPFSNLATAFKAGMSKAPSKR
jgi:hypothetical protein